MEYSSLILLTCATICLSAPADNPIRIDLPVYEPSENDPTVMAVMENREAPSEMNIDANGGQFTRKFDIASNVITDNLVSSKTGGAFSEPVTTLEGAILETEGLGSQTLSAKENLHQLVAGLFQPKPLVDTITEEEKYGNSGDKFYSAGKALVGGAENISNLINSALEVPGTIFRNIARSASQKLNNLGGRIVGLYNR